MIIETSANQFFRVEETNETHLAHCWFGVAVKKVGGVWVDKKNNFPHLIRKAATRLVQEAA